MIGFGATIVSKSAELFSPVDEMDKDEKAARFSAQREGDRRKVGFGFTGQATYLTQIITGSTDPDTDA